MGGLSHTVSGDIASFRTPSRVPIESLKFHFLPKQEGSGDLSPSNVRPITGWTGLNGRRAGKNIGTVQQLIGNRIYTSVTEDNRQCIYVRASGEVPISFVGAFKANKQYTVSFYAKYVKSPEAISDPTSPFRFYFDYSDGTSRAMDIPSINIDQWVHYSFTSASGKSITNMRLGNFEYRAYVYFDINTFMLNEGSTEETYEPYFGELIPITFPDGQTIYGGYIDLVYGELVVEWREQSLKDLNWGNYSGNTLFYASIPTYGKNLYSEIYSDHFPVVVNSNPRDNETIGCYKNGAVYAKYIFFYKTGVGNPAGFINWINHLEYDPKIVYKLETPIHILIPENDIKSFLDHNNFWSDANDITEVTYAVVESKDMFDARKRIMSKTWNMLPLLYTEVEYISAKDSNPYIDMGIKFTGELEAEVHYYNDKNEAFLFGARKGASSTPYCNFNIESASSDRSRFDYGNQKAVATSGLPFAGYHDGEYIFRFHNRTATMEKVSTGEVVTKDYSSFVRTDYSDYNMLLFSVNTNGTPSLNTGTGELRVHSAKFWIGGQLVRNLVPCFRKSDNKPGMYDRVSKTFFTNAGSGEFSLPA